MIFALDTWKRLQIGMSLDPRQTALPRIDPVADTRVALGAEPQSVFDRDSSLLPKINIKAV
jgi:hypothetical protein